MLFILQLVMNTTQIKKTGSKYKVISRRYKTVKLMNDQKQEINNEKIDIFSIISNPFFAFIISPFLAYICFFNVMSRVLDFSILLGSVIFSISLLFLMIPLLKMTFIVTNSSVYIFKILSHKKAIIPVNNMSQWSHKVYQGRNY